MQSSESTKLLVSVRDASEAALALAAAVDWIDLKEPRAGSLGQPTLATALEVSLLLHQHKRRSVALGEFHELNIDTALRLAELFPFVKVGLSHWHDAAEANQRRFLELADRLRTNHCELIAVAYADAAICAAPNLDAVVALAQAAGSRYLLIDTFVKDGRGLLDWLSLEALREVIKQAAEFHCGVVLAGSLTLSDAPKLASLQPTALAVRGAVCALSDQPSAVQRSAAIDSERLAQWCSMLSS